MSHGVATKCGKCRTAAKSIKSARKCRGKTREFSAQGALQAKPYCNKYPIHCVGVSSMSNMSKAIAQYKVQLNVDNLFVAAVWFLSGIIATYLTTISPEAQISGQAWCSLFSPSGTNVHSMFAFGHCGWCYVAVAAFGASGLSLFKRA
ncbi:MAG: hypothetical protein FD163_1768 [Hyphomonadaceae bacterium]|nr:MAG: hypothetical protein FD128_1184 [Hyphomonadaceae bacterium]KAF0185071.1 MAG: hypothetical protein FD163_1768 [Hyphomonadaceae bacterium]